ncbi:MAG: FAD:protein FMN transferase [Alistipes senegalensis]|nr:FAD:protein FMN transferase [Oxalobacter formigenes]MCM1280357.1 FAD:protein FMN transferase [Alistipes senegalensis]
MELLYKVQERFLFHAHIRIKIPAAWPDTAFDSLYAVLEEVDKKYNSYRAGSTFDQINRHAGRFVEVDNETVRLLKQVITLSELFDGAYDITIMPLIRLWGFYKNENRRVPAPEEIAAACRKVNYQQIEIKGNRVRIGPEQEIITGSFIKAYATDRLVAAMREKGIGNAIINAGGSTIFAINPAGDPWPVSVDSPEDDSALFTLNLDNAAYSTSSQTTAFVDINGKRYGHILNPKTGYPSPNRLTGILSESALIGDILTTGLFNETPESFLEKMQRINTRHPVLGFIMGENGIVTASPGFTTHTA